MSVLLSLLNPSTNETFEAEQNRTNKTVHIVHVYMMRFHDKFCSVTLTVTTIILSTKFKQKNLISNENHRLVGLAGSVGILYKLVKPNLHYLTYHTFIRLSPQAQTGDRYIFIAVPNILYHIIISEEKCSMRQQLGQKIEYPAQDFF